MHQVMWEISFANLNMLMATVPTYEDKDENEKASGEVKDLTDIFNEE